MTSGAEPRTLAGRYRLDEVIGRGGMSTVYRGTDLALDRPVAVKVALDPLVEESPIYLERFTREANSTAAIDHPGVVTVYDAGADGPTRFIVMEFVEGRSLADILRDESPLEPTRAADIAARVADALSATHGRGIVHRDIKPANIMILPDGSVKVLDFGIARVVDSGTLTQTATVLGTSAYMSPEQALGQPADARSDIYSLGCVLYEMLTGEPPFMADVSAAVLHQHVRVAPKSARERNPEIPPALDALVMEMIAKAPGDRPQTAAEVRDRLRQAVGNPGTRGGTSTTLAMAAAVPPPPPPATVPPPEPMVRRTAPPPPPPPDRSRSRAGLWVTFGVLAALLLGGAVALALSGTGGSNSATSDHSSPPITTSHENTPSNGTTPPTTSPTTPTTTPSQPTTSPSHTTTTKPSTTTSTTTTSAPATTTSGAPTTGTNTASTGGTTP